MSPPLAIFFEGQFGPVFSTGMLLMAANARQDGIEAHVLPWGQLNAGRSLLVTGKRDGRKVSAIGMSLGAGTVELLSAQHNDIDLLIGIDPSRDGINYRVDRLHTKRSVLIHNNNIVSKLTGIGGAGEVQDPGGDLGFQFKIEIDDLHVLVTEDPRVIEIVRNELKALV